MPDEMKANRIYILLKKKKDKMWHYVTTSEIPLLSFCCLLNVPGGFPVAVAAFVNLCLHCFCFVFFLDVKQVIYSLSIPICHKCSLLHKKVGFTGGALKR